MSLLIDGEEECGCCVARPLSVRVEVKEFVCLSAMVTKKRRIPSIAGANQVRYFLLFLVAFSTHSLFLYLCPCLFVERRKLGSMKVAAGGHVHGSRLQ